MVERRQTRGQGQEAFQPPRVPFRVRPDDAALAHRGESKAPFEDVGSPDQRSVEGVYVISVAARLLEMHPQTLRKYERLGLICPVRTIGMLRLYSEEDLQKLRLIRYLEENLGLNLAGVEWALTMVNHLFDMQRRLSTLEQVEHMHHTLRQEMRRLFQALSLPFEEPTPGAQKEE